MTLAQSAEVLDELGRLGDARMRVRQALALSHAMNDRFGVVHELRLLASLAAEADNMRRAGILLGAAEAEHERAPVGPWIHAWEKSLDLRAGGDQDLVLGREEGRRLDLDAAVARALTED